MQRGVNDETLCYLGQVSPLLRVEIRLEIRLEIRNYTWLSNQLKYFSSDTASTAIGINPWYTPQISEH